MENDETFPLPVSHIFAKSAISTSDTFGSPTWDLLKKKKKLNKNMYVHGSSSQLNC